MNLKILMIILGYYTFISLFLFFGLSSYGDYTFTDPINDTAIQGSEVTTGGIFGAGVSFTRFIGLATIGVGLPGTVPAWFSIFFIAWQSIFLVFSVGFIISAIWNG